MSLKIKLDSNKTAFLLVCKGHKIITKYDIEFCKFTGEDTVLNDFRELVKTYCVIYYLNSSSSIDIRHINFALIDLLNELKHDGIINVLKHCCDVSRNSAVYYNEILFYKLFSEIQTIQIIRDNKELYDLDYSLIKH